MTRLLGVALLAALACLAAGAAAAAPVLRPAVEVSAPVIRLGDLFAGAGSHAADVVAPAPPPGSRTLFDAAWLAATAHEHGLDWQPASQFDRSVVDRATRTIGADAVAARLRQEIGQQQSLAGAQLQLDNPALHLKVPAEAGTSIAVDGLNIDPRNGRFSAFVSAPAGAADAERLRVTGQIIRMVEVPVLTRNLGPGDIIGAGDIAKVRLRADRVAPDAITEAHDLIGKTPRRPLRAETPLHTADIQSPITVHKGDLVTLVLETAHMRLTAQGKALENGGMGAAIRVANTKSNRLLDAVVTGPNLVAVLAPSQLASRQETQP